MYIQASVIRGWCRIIVGKGNYLCRQLAKGKQTYCLCDVGQGWENG